jgi:hypothetical protein
MEFQLAGCTRAGLGASAPPTCYPGTMLWPATLAPPSSCADRPFLSCASNHHQRHGADASAGDALGNTPAHLAVQGGHLDLLVTLLQVTAPGAQAALGGTHLQMCAPLDGVESVSAGMCGLPCWSLKGAGASRRLGWHLRRRLKGQQRLLPSPQHARGCTHSSLCCSPLRQADRPPDIDAPNTAGVTVRQLSRAAMDAGEAERARRQGVQGGPGGQQPSSGDDGRGDGDEGDEDDEAGWRQRLREELSDDEAGGIGYGR